jgi:pectate lyase
VLKTVAVLALPLVVSLGCGTTASVDTRPVESRAESPSVSRAADQAADPGTGTAEPATAPRVLGTQATRRRAFPGAQGYGTATPGGRGGRVIEVTNLKSGGPGSFRAAATAKGRRIIVFRVSGTITLQREVDITNPYVTIAGQTAPGGGITLRADPCNDGGVLGVHTHDVVIRYLRLRPGPHPCAGPGESSDGIVIYKKGAHHVVVDHCSISWAVDENLSLYDDAHHVTFSWNIISEGLSNSTHEEGEHSKGAHLSGENTYAISFHHNLLAHNNDRNPQPTNPGRADIRNNVVYNYGENAALTSNSHGRPHFNFVGNRYIPGPDTDRSEHELDVYGPTDVGWRFFVRGNIGPHRPSNDLPQARTVSPEGRSSMVDRPFATAPVTTTGAGKATRQVLARAGATKPHRDAVDRRVVGDVRDRSGRIIDSPAQVGGWPSLPAQSPPRDSDHDGMPDSWERDRGLRPNHDDSAGDQDGDGWTNVEEYLDSLVR